MLWHCVSSSSGLFRKPVMTNSLPTNSTFSNRSSCIGLACVYSSTEIEDTMRPNPRAPPKTFAPRIDGRPSTSETVMLMPRALL